MDRRKMILVVEDNPDDEALTLRALQKNHIAHEIMVVHDGVEALDYLFGRGQFADRDMSIMPELVLLDLKLPKIDGLEVLRHLRHDERTALIPVIVLTTSDEVTDRLESYRLYANSFIRKPVDFNKFMDAIRQIGMYWLVLNEPPPV